MKDIKWEPCSRETYEYAKSFQMLPQLPARNEIFECSCKEQNMVVIYYKTPTFGNWVVADLHSHERWMTWTWMANAEFADSIKEEVKNKANKIVQSYYAAAGGHF